MQWSLQFGSCTVPVPASPSSSHPGPPNLQRQDQEDGGRSLRGIPGPARRFQPRLLLGVDDLALAWFSGSAEGADNCSIVLALLPNGSLQWSRASLVSRRPGYSNQNPVLFLDPTGQVLYLFYSQQPAAGQRSVVGSAEAQANIWMLQSFDGGVSWTTPRDVFTKNGSFDRNRIIYSLKGDWLFPSITLQRKKRTSSPRS